MLICVLAALEGPPSGSEGIRIAQYANEQPDVTFFNGLSAAIERSFVDPAPNFYRFNTDDAQWTAPAGSYLVNERGWDNMVVVSEDYSSPYAQVFGDMGPFCAVWGKVSENHIVPLGSKEYSSVIALLPMSGGDVDGIFMVLGGSEAVNFLTQCAQLGEDLPIVGGSITVDQTALTAEGPVSDNDDLPARQEFFAKSQAFFGDEGLPSPSLFAFNDYVSTKAALLGLQEVNGDLSDPEADRAALDTLSFETPTGTVAINENLQATTSFNINEVVEGEDSHLKNEPLARVEGIDQYPGLGKEAFTALGLPSCGNPSCE
ncbi:ABC transporter substrate-binding protein [Primorskyibacter sp. 2E107]|uniref:ABC transporter substrate-binding protein n=1 Tax=Primorskyibacter sp. 2E107 TaxID=3403458 RepID=UPI003AF42D97